MRTIQAICQVQKAAAPLAGLCVLAVLLFAGRPSAYAQASGKAAELLDAARNAVSDRQIDKTPLGGFSQTRTPFSETPRSGILVGFDVGLGKYLENESIYALRPIYLTPEGVYSTKDYGSFAAGSRGRTKGRLTRTKQLKAKAGYAVGAIHIKREQGIRALALEYMRMDGPVLDPTNTYTSAWAGDAKSGEEVTLSGHGAPIVGIHGNLDEDKVLGLGLQFIRNAPVTKKAADKTGGTTPGSQGAAEDGAAEDATIVEEEEEDELVEEGSTSLWIPLVTFAVVALPIFLIMLAMFGRKAPPPPPPQLPAPDQGIWAMAGPSIGGLSPAYREPLYGLDEARGAAWKSCYMGLIGMIAWCLPIAGVPVNIIGLTSGMKGLQSDRAPLAVVGIILSSIGLLLSIVNAILGVMMATGNLKV